LTYTLTPNVEVLVLNGSGDIGGTGNDLGNIIIGNAGNNRIDGGIGADAMIGGSGNDLYIVDNTGDQITEAAGGGADAVFSSVNYGLGDNLESLHLTGTAIVGVGNALNNTVEGNASDNVIDAGVGADIMRGGLGNDTYVVDNAGDQVMENAGQGHDVVYSTISSTLATNAEDLYLAGSGNINGTGNSAANSVVGNSGNNTIDGGAGADVLIGGGGNDIFAFRAGEASGDTVSDFVSGTDSLQFAGYGAGATFTQNDATHWQVDDGVHHDIITFSNAAVIQPADFHFV
jgi:Ca2+-binding RTX toxin-like protein